MRSRRYFEGWYLKQQNDAETLALIPAYHADNSGAASASLQVIADDCAHNVPLPAQAFSLDRKKRVLRLAGCTFSRDGCALDLRSDGCAIRGALQFVSPVSPRYDIMGPFAAVPWMECRHSVFSLFHRVNGALSLNGREYRFDGGAGYMEGDRGTSFPRRYVWTQCALGGDSIMLSVADIPFGPLHFVGIVGFVYIRGRECRVATYRGARPVDIRDDFVSVRQGRLLLTVEVLRANAHALRAPHRGDMARTIHESAACTARYSCFWDGKQLFQRVSERASFEGNWRDAHEPPV